MNIVKKFATTIAEASDQRGMRRDAQKLEFIRTTAAKSRWELIGEAGLTSVETWDDFGLTYAERRFMENQDVPSGHMLLPQYAVRVNSWRTQREEWRFVDFVLVRKGDLAPIIAFEIDGDSHYGRMVFDALRDKEINAQLNCTIVHIANTKLNAKKIFAYVEEWHKKIAARQIL